MHHTCGCQNMNKKIKRRTRFTVHPLKNCLRVFVALELYQVGG